MIERPGRRRPIRATTPSGSRPTSNICASAGPDHAGPDARQHGYTTTPTSTTPIGDGHHAVGQRHSRRHLSAGWGTSPIKYKGTQNPTDIAGYDKLNAYPRLGQHRAPRQGFRFRRHHRSGRASASGTKSRKPIVTATIATGRSASCPTIIEKTRRRAFPPAIPCPMPASSSSSVQAGPITSPSSTSTFIPADGLTITPGVKYVSLTRKVAAPVGSKTRTTAIRLDHYHHVLPLPVGELQDPGQLGGLWPIRRGLPDPAAQGVLRARSAIQHRAADDLEHLSARHGLQRQQLQLRRRHLLCPRQGLFRRRKPSRSRAAASTTAYVNDGNVDFKGIEAEGTYAFTDGALDGLAVFANGSINSAEGVTKIVKGKLSADYHHQIKNVPKWTAAFGLIYRMDNIRFSLINKINGEQWADSGEPAAYKIPAYNMTNLVVGLCLRQDQAAGRRLQSVRRSFGHGYQRQ